MTRQTARIEALLAVAQHPATPTQEASTALAGAFKAIARLESADERQSYQLRASLISVSIAARNFADIFKPVRS